MVAWEIACLSFLVLTMLVNVAMTSAAFVILFKFKSAKQVSDENESILTPPRYVFFIWPVIYAWQTLTLIWSLAVPDVYIDRIWPWYITLCLLNVLWCILFSLSKLTPSCFINMGMFWCVLEIYFSLDVRYFPLDPVKLWVYNVPFSIYFGWLTIALLANLFTAKWFEVGEINIGDDIKIPKESVAATFFLLLLLTPIRIMIFSRGDFFYVAAVMWGLIGIIFKNRENPAILQIGVVVTASTVVMCVASVFLNNY